MKNERIKKIEGTNRYEYKCGSMWVRNYGVLVNVKGIASAVCKDIEEAKKWIEDRLFLENINQVELLKSRG